MRPGPIALALALLAPFAAAQAPQYEHSVYLHEYSGGLHIVPEQINANVGDVLKLVILNQGANDHNLLVCGDPVDEEPDCEEVWARSSVLGANETETITLTVNEAGTFDYYCSLFTHKQLKMRGALVVAGENERFLPLGPLVVVALAAAALVGRSRA